MRFSPRNAIAIISYNSILISISAAVLRFTSIRLYLAGIFQFAEINRHFVFSLPPVLAGCLPEVWEY